MKAIETIYNGYRFRSRLEARWAVFFDEMGIKYEYEPEGFELSDGTRYLPDFYLPELKCYVEIKHSEAIKVSREKEMPILGWFTFTESDTEKYYKFIDEITQNGFVYFLASGDPVDAISALKNKRKYKEPKAWVFAKINCALRMFNVSCQNECEKCPIFEQPWVSFEFVGFSKDKKILFYSRLTANDIGAYVLAVPDHENIKIVIDDNDFINCFDVYNYTMASYKARQARFEHGEKP